MSTPVNSIQPEYKPQFIPEGTKIELPYNEKGKLSKKIDELTVEEFNMLKEEVAIVSHGMLGIEQEYEVSMESPTYSAEAIEMNKKHVALVTTLAEKYGSVASSESALLPLSVRDLRLTEVAAMLHDIEKNKIFTNEEERLMWHHIWSAETSADVLRLVGLEDADVTQVSTMIIEHQPMPFVATALDLAVKDPGHKWAKAGEALPTAIPSDQLSATQRKMLEVWESGKFDRPSSKASAVLFCADLLSPSEVIDQNFLEAFRDSGEDSLKDYLDSKSMSFELGVVAAGSFDRYVLANLRWNKPLMDGYQSAYMSLYNNVIELGSEVSKVKDFESDLPQDEYTSRMEAALTMSEIAQNFGQAAVIRINEVGNKLSEGLTEAKKLEEDLPEDQQVLTRYENLYYTLNQYREVSLSDTEKANIQTELAELKPAYITKSMYLLYSSALPVFAKE